MITSFIRLKYPFLPLNHTLLKLNVTPCTNGKNTVLRHTRGHDFLDAMDVLSHPSHRLRKFGEKNREFKIRKIRILNLCP